MLEYFKLFIIGISLYFNPQWTKTLVNRFFKDLHFQTEHGFKMDAKKIHKHFLSAFLASFSIVLLAVIILIIANSFDPSCKTYLRLFSIALILTGTLSKLPWKIIQLQDNMITHIVEYSLFVISQLLGTLLLILALFL